MGNMATLWDRLEPVEVNEAGFVIDAIADAKTEGDTSVVISSHLSAETVEMMRSKGYQVKLAEVNGDPVTKIGWKTGLRVVKVTRADKVEEIARPSADDIDATYKKLAERELQNNEFRRGWRKFHSGGLASEKKI
jgi:hypothetical protein